MMLKLVLLIVSLEAMAGEDAYCDKNDLRYLFAKVHNMEKQVNKLKTELEELNSKFDITSVKLNSEIGDITEQLKSITSSTDGGWSAWSAWGNCSAKCGTGLQTRKRTCSNPAPELHGTPCVGDVSENQLCAPAVCPGFSVYTPVKGTGESSFSTLKFSLIVENSASAFNMATGEFVCQQPGLYFFSNTIMRHGSSTEDSYCYFYKNGNQHSKTAGFASDRDSTLYPSGTNAILYHLLPGDTVSLRNCRNTNFFDVASSFTGFLVHTDN